MAGIFAQIQLALGPHAQFLQRGCRAAEFSAHINEMSGPRTGAQDRLPLRHKAQNNNVREDSVRGFGGVATGQGYAISSGHADETASETADPASGKITRQSE